MGDYRVWCLSYDDTEKEGKSYPDKPSVAGGYVEQLLASDRWALSAQDAAETYADYVHSNRDGHEDTWPLKFRVRSPDGTIADFEVDREYSPEFSAHEIEVTP